MDTNSIIEQLRDDDNYYGDLGRKFLSNSDIKVLHDSPDLYGMKWDSNIDFIKGRYLHTRILEPHRIGEIPVIDASTRNTKVYKDFVAEHHVEGMDKPIFLLKKEADEVERLCRRVEYNEEFADALQGNIQENEIEEPMIGELFGYWFKGKSDRINQHRGFIADIKTTKSLSSFVSNFRKYGYHSQAYIYQHLFGLPVRFYVICKESGRLGIYDVSEETLNEAEDYIKYSLDNMELYYGENPTLSIEQFYQYQEI